MFLSIYKCINIYPLKNRRTVLLFEFLHNLLLGNIDCEELLTFIRFKINSLNIRNSDLFYPIPYKMNYMINNPSNILMAAGNSITFDFVYHVLFSTSFFIVIYLIRFFFVYMCNFTIVFILVIIVLFLCHISVYNSLLTVYCYYRACVYNIVQDLRLFISIIYK